MTLAPIENRRVRAVPAERYPLNPFCANPECENPTNDPHHIFRRSAIGGDSWFVVIAEDTESGAVVEHPPIPHVAGLCRECHDKIGAHDFWIKYEGEVFVLYKRDDAKGPQGNDLWSPIGPLYPQPGGHDTVPKRRRRAFKGEERRNRATISIKVPKDAKEDGAGIWDDLIERVSEKLEREGLDGDRPLYYLLVDALNDWLND